MFVRCGPKLRLIDSLVSHSADEDEEGEAATALGWMRNNSAQRLEKFMHEHKLKWFSVSSNIILRRHGGFIEEIPQKYYILSQKLDLNFHVNLRLSSSMCVHGINNKTFSLSLLLYNQYNWRTY